MLISHISIAQNDPLALAEGEIKMTIDAISNQLQHNYVFPDVAEEMIAALKKNYKQGKYDSAPDAVMFSEMLTRDLRTVSNDKHIRVLFDPQRIKRRSQAISKEDSLRIAERRLQSMAMTNFGFESVQILDGNVGYLNLKNFADPAFAKETAAAAMTFLGNTDAIIIDLRNNGGGSSEMVQLLSSYFFGEESVHLNSLYWRSSDTTTETWTIPNVEGLKNPDADVYILTSDYTFSAAEEFSYNLQSLGKATIVGETTGGGAHPGNNEVVTDRFMIFVPSGRAINPITKTNWEGTGVVPDVEVKSDQALLVAKMKAYETLKDKSNEPRAIGFYNWTLEELNAKYKPVSLQDKLKQTYVGEYGERKITLEDGTLFYQRGEGVKYELIAFSQNDFILKGNKDFRIHMVTENNEVKAIKGRYFGGRTDLSEKTN